VKTILSSDRTSFFIHHCKTTSKSGVLLSLIFGFCVWRFLLISRKNIFYYNTGVVASVQLYFGIFAVSNAQFGNCVVWLVSEFIHIFLHGLTLNRYESWGCEPWWRRRTEVRSVNRDWVGEPGLGWEIWRWSGIEEGGGRVGVEPWMTVVDVALNRGHDIDGNAIPGTWYRPTRQTRDMISTDTPNPGHDIDRHAKPGTW
jgi:hypothetical protein